MAFDTELFLAGPLREPKQMLAKQEYGGHLSIHDDETAEKLGFAAGPIEGPTHFSQFVLLLVDVWGTDFLERGCLSAHYQNVCTEGDRVRAFVARPARDGDRHVRIWAEKADGTPVLTGIATIGPDHETSELDARLARLRVRGPRAHRAARRATAAQPERQDPESGPEEGNARPAGRRAREEMKLTAP